MEYASIHRCRAPPSQAMVQRLAERYVGELSEIIGRNVVESRRLMVEGLHRGVILRGPTRRVGRLGNKNKIHTPSIRSRALFGGQKAVLRCGPVSSAPSANPSATLSDDIGTSPRWPRRPFIRTKASTKRENAVPTPSASNEGQVFKGGESLAVDGEQHTDRAIGSAGPCEVHA